MKRTWAWVRSLTVAALCWSASAQQTAAWLDPDKSEPAGTKYRTFSSKTIQGDVSYLIYLPPDYNTATTKHYPVVYWLHGLGGNQRGGAVFVAQLDAAIKAGQAPPMIAVLVNGLRDSRYYDSFDGKRPVETVIIRELIPYIDKTYRTVTSRQGRAIEGYSMGGFGAARLAFKYPNLFGMVSIMAGALLDTESVGTTMHSELVEKNFGGNRAYFHAGSPWVLADRNAERIAGRTFVRIGVGELDPLYERNLTYHEMLERLGIKNEFFGVPGVAHNGRVFYEKLGGEAFAFYRKALSGESAYHAEIREWRELREAELKADDGWLTVAGLFWLKEGINRAGPDPANEIVLPAGSAPPRIGAFEFHQGSIIFRAEPGAMVTRNGRPVTAAELEPDRGGAAEVIAIGSVTMYVIKRGQRYGVRLKDRESKLRKEFTGLQWFPIEERTRIIAKFVPYEPPKVLAIPTILGDVEKSPSPGYTAFELNGKEYRLDPTADEDGSLFFVFRDLTSGKETYPAGRFLDSEAPHQGKVVLDFNKAYNPPCAFTPYVTCPLPPRQNQLPVRIEAGELKYGNH